MGWMDSMFQDGVWAQVFNFGTGGSAFSACWHSVTFMMVMRHGCIGRERRCSRFDWTDSWLRLLLER